MAIVVVVCCNLNAVLKINAENAYPFLWNWLQYFAEIIFLVCLFESKGFVGIYFAKQGLMLIFKLIRYRETTN